MRWIFFNQPANLTGNFSHCVEVFVFSNPTKNVMCTVRRIPSKTGHTTNLFCQIHKAVYRLNFGYSII